MTERDRAVTVHPPALPLNYLHMGRGSTKTNETKSTTISGIRGDAASNGNQQWALRISGPNSVYPSPTGQTAGGSECALSQRTCTCVRAGLG